MATADVTTTTTINPYEAARLQCVEENKRRFEALGISKISKSLSEVTKTIKKSKRDSKKLTRKMIFDALGPDLRRSSRSRTAVITYSEELPTEIRRSRKRSHSRSDIVRPENGGRRCTKKEQEKTFKVAEKFQSNLHSQNPSFVKQMSWSHVYSCFWMGLPSDFCKSHLPTVKMEMVLEDDKGSECNSVYIGDRTGLSGGWKGFAKSHNLEEGDALVFELVGPDRFKIYIFKASENEEENKADAADSAKSKRVKKLPENAGTSLTTSKNAQKASSSRDKLISGTHQQKGQSARTSKNTKGRRPTRSKKDTGKNVTSSQEVQPGSKSKSKSKKRAALSENVEGSVSEEVEPEVDDVPKSRKRGAATKTQLFRRKAF